MRKACCPFIALASLALAFFATSVGGDEIIPILGYCCTPAHEDKPAGCASSDCLPSATCSGTAVGTAVAGNCGTPQTGAQCTPSGSINITVHNFTCKWKTCILPNGYIGARCYWSQGTAHHTESVGQCSGTPC